MANQDQAFPRLDAPPIDLKTGLWTRPWYRLIVSMWNRIGTGGAASAVTVGASPVAYTAQVPGFLLISGGTVTGVTMTRGGVVTTFPASTALLPLSPGDAASVTYTVAPTITFIPR